MTTTEEKLVEKVKGLSELEFETFFEELAVHIKRQDWAHIIMQHFAAESIYGLTDALSGLADEANEIKQKVVEIKKDLKKFIK